VGWQAAASMKRNKVGKINLRIILCLQAVSQVQEKNTFM
jgi:hypothetical protein